MGFIMHEATLAGVLVSMFWLFLLVWQRPAFEVVSVKAAPKGCPSVSSPGFISQCRTVEAQIQMAYNLAAFGPRRTPGRRLQIVGGPEWVRTEPFEITARAGGAAVPDQMYGPMMQVLLEDRFKLVVRRETREMPVYFLTVAKGGLTASRNVGCVVADHNRPSEDPKKECGWWGNLNGVLEAYGNTLGEFADVLSNMAADRVVVDRTGLAGLFDFRVEFGGEYGASLFTALQEQVGLRLSAGRGAVDVLVIDRVERPSGN